MIIIPIHPPARRPRKDGKLTLRPLLNIFRKMNQMTANPQPVPRNFLPKDFTITTWEALQPYFQQLQDRSINSEADLQQWLKNVSELEAVISEDASWRQIRMTLDTTNTEYE